MNTSTTRSTMRVLTVLALALALFAFPFIARADGPSISSEYSNYVAGDTVGLSGAGWQGGEAVHVFVNDNVGSTWSYSTDVVADGAGTFAVTFQLPSWFVATYNVTATGPWSGTATTTFSDAAAATVTFTTDAPCAVTVNVTDFTNNGGQTHRSTSGPTPLTIGTLAGTSVTFTYQSSVVCSGTTYNFVSASPSSPLTSGAAGSNTTVSGHYVVADSTPPVISYVLTPSSPDGSNGWYTSNVTLVWSVTDPESAVTKTGCVDQNITADQVATTYTCSATSAGGSSGPVSVTIKRDATAPTISFVGPSTSLWYNADVTANWSCTDALSGPVSAAVSDTTSGEGAALPATGTCTDNAGNTASDTQSFKVDKTAPTIAFVSRTAANGNGWNNTDVTVNWSCADSLSGVVNASVSQTVSSEGTNQSVTGTCTDKAGNTASDTQSGINIDKTKPTIVAAATTAPNANGWYNSDVTIHFSCTDTLSGIPNGACPADQVLSAEGSAVSSTAETVTDAAGNTSDPSNVVTVKIDKTPPTITFVSPSTAPWYNADVTANWSCSDALSGVVSASVNATTSGEGAAVPVTGTCTDLAGNTASDTQNFKVDKTPPSYGTPTATANGNPYTAGAWTKYAVVVSFPCNDALSGAVTNPVVKTFSNEGANQTANAAAAECEDQAGNQAATGASFSPINIDKTAPTISYAGQTPVANGNGWNNTNVTLTWDCADTLSGPVAANVSQTLSGEGANQSATGTCTDNAGNTASDTHGGINIDITVPTLSPSVSPNPVVLNGSATASPGASDSLSGIDTASCSAVDTSTVSSHSVNCTATDKAGNTANKTASYSVIYGFSGFLQPINDTGRPYACPSPCPISVFKAGSTIPAKFQLKDANGNIVQASSLPQWLTPVKGSATNASIDESQYTDPASSGNTYRWDSTSQQYIYNWGTPKNGAGYYWRIFVKFDDGMTYFVDVGLR